MGVGRTAGSNTDHGVGMTITSNNTMMATEPNIVETIA